ncbi:unnamed protein product, partial [Staurois parvus]
ISVPKAVTPSYTRAYPAALLRQVFFTYLTPRSHDVSPAASPAISFGRCRHPASVSCPCDVGTYGRRSRRRRGKFKNFKKCHFFFFYIFTYALSWRPACIFLFFL